tara:strand:- start:60 stop:1085 length:1026 start_codon:yes stop_codon:yes gene_type:complete
MSEKTQREVFIERVNNVITSTTTDLIKNSKSNQVNGILIFNEIESKVEELKDYLNQISLDNLNILPDSRFNILNAKLKPVFDKLDEIQKTDKNPNQTDVQQKAQTIQFFTYGANQGGNGYFEKEKEEIWKIILEAITLDNQKLQDNSIAVKKAKELEKVIKSAKDSQEEINKVLNSARTELSKGGVSKHSDIFGTQANVHKKSAENWQKYAVRLLATNGILVIIILSLVIWVVEDKTLRIEVGIFGAVLISLVSYAVVLCVKNFFAEKHNQNVNQHRANCLGTYNTFIDSADEERKAAVLLQATTTIFSHQKSGYLTKDTETNNPNPIVEIVRKVASGKAE